MQLLIVDTTGIQPYIFGSNRLRENIGASHLIAQATEEWALAIMPTPNNVVDAKTGKLGDARIKDDGLVAEVLYAGGGNIVALFDGKGKADEFTRQLSRKALEDAPNLQLVIVQQEFDWNIAVLAQAVDCLFKQLAQEKRARPLSAPLLGLGVMVMCQSTGLPATEVTQPIRNDPGYPASAEIHAKIDVARATGAQPSAADERLRHDISPPDAYGYPSDFDDLGGSKGEHSYIAIVHADGNGMGQRIMDIGKAHPTAEKNRAYIAALRAFSKTVEESAQAALKATLKKLIDQIKVGKIAHPTLPKLSVTLATDKETGKPLLPFRPIVFGGDDVTFVCDGRLGLSLAIEYLRQFENETAKRADCNDKITACAGIAIVKTHYPFARAYTLAEELCKSAKIYRHRQSLDDSCLDWHFAFSGLAGDIEEIRRREYTGREGSLTLRPLTLNRNTKEPQHAWDVVREGIAVFQGEGWAGRRNKVKALRDTLREGSEAAKQFLTKFNGSKPLPVVEPSMTNWPTEGWQGPYCGYFDAIELADWFIPLQGGQAS